MADSIGQLQGAILELSELMCNGLGLVQRNAGPVSAQPDAAEGQVPLSVEGEAAAAQWQASRALQPAARQDFAEAVVQACKKIDLLAQVSKMQRRFITFSFSQPLSTPSEPA